MSGAGDRARSGGALLRRLFPGPLGEEIAADLLREYDAVRERSSRAGMYAWTVAQILRPDTWRLAWTLRRSNRAALRTGRAPDQTRRRSGLSGVSLDVKLAWRMLAKTPGLSAIGVLGIALGTAVGTGFFVVLSSHMYPALPLEDGHRMVAIQNWDAGQSTAVAPALRHYQAWNEVRTVAPIAAASLVERSLISGDAAPVSVRAAEMTASGFQAARVQPLIGRYLLPEDESQAAAAVAVLGYDLWQRHFEGDVAVIGRAVLIGDAQHTVVGIMPPGFALPKNQELWTALRTGSAAPAAPQLFVFGRLAPGISRDQAAAEFAVVGPRAAPEFAGDERHLRPQVVPFTYPLDNIRIGTLWQAAQVQLMVNLLLVAIAVNVAVLVYARTAMRQGEIALRAALGARRRRIVAQLMVESFVLALLGTGLGLLLAHAGLRQLESFMGGMDGVGFWVNYGVRPLAAAYALGLALLTAVIVGVVPALKSTGRALEADLRRMGGKSSARLGRAWTALIVAQVGIAVAVLPAALHLGFREVRMGAVRATFPAHEFLKVDLGLAVPLEDGMDADAYRRATTARFADRLPELERRLEADAAVRGVTYEGRLPERGASIEVETAHGATASAPLRVPSSGVAPDYFELLGARILAGRDFVTADARGSGGGIIVNEAFVRHLLPAGQPLGQRIRFARQPDAEAATGEFTEWVEIIGVVEDLQASLFDREWAPPMVYYPLLPEQLHSAALLVRVRGDDAASFAPRIRQTITALDPAFRVAAVANLAALRNPQYLALAVATILLVLATVLLLSAAGIHALMSLTVTRRRKEIAVRSALGGRPAAMLANIFSRAAWQLGLGGLLGAVLGGALLFGSGLSGKPAAALLGGVIALMLVAGLSAALGPARRGLAVQPMEALKEE